MGGGGGGSEPRTGIIYDLYDLFVFFVRGLKP